MNKEERITYEEFMTMFKNAPRIAYMLYDKAEDEIDRLNNISKELVEDVFTLLRVLDRNVKELDCSNEELKIINKYSYNSKEAKND